jgi:hypothetical protein
MWFRDFFQRFIIVFTGVHCWSKSRARWIQCKCYSFINLAYPWSLSNKSVDHDVHFQAQLMCLYSYAFAGKFRLVYSFVLLETRQQTVKAPYEPSSWRGNLVKILRPIGHTSKIVFHLLPLLALHKSNGLLFLFSSPSLKESNKNTKRTKYGTTQG